MDGLAPEDMNKEQVSGPGPWPWPSPAQGGWVLLSHPLSGPSLEPLPGLRPSLPSRLCSPPSLRHQQFRANQHTRPSPQPPLVPKLALRHTAYLKTKCNTAIEELFYSMVGIWKEIFFSDIKAIYIFLYFLSILPFYAPDGYGTVITVDEYIVFLCTLLTIKHKELFEATCPC